MDNARRIKYSLMLSILIGAGLAMLASTQNWFDITLVPSADHPATVTMQGSSAAPALTALALAGIALAVALSIAGRIARIVLGVLGAIVGVCILISAFSGIGDPIGTAGSAITQATGVAGRASVSHLVQEVRVEFWAWCAVAGGIIVILGSVAVPVTTGRWPDASRRFQAVRFEAQDGASGGDDDADEPRETPATSRDLAIDSWDELSRGSDPTARGSGRPGQDDE